MPAQRSRRRSEVIRPEGTWLVAYGTYDQARLKAGRDGSGKRRLAKLPPFSPAKRLGRDPFAQRHHGPYKKSGAWLDNCSRPSSRPRAQALTADQAIAGATWRPSLPARRQLAGKAIACLVRSPSMGRC